MGIICFALMFTPIEVLLEVFRNSIARSYELEADKFAADTGYSKELQDGLIKSYLKNLEDYNPDWMYANYHYSHPLIADRLKLLSENKKNE